MEELKTIWTRQRLITAWNLGEQYEVTVLNASSLVYEEGFNRKFTDWEAAEDYAMEIARWFERIPV